MKIRDANLNDITALEQIKASTALHRDRIRDASNGDFRYLVLEDDTGEILGHACLVFRRPKAWPKDDGEVGYPRIIDLMINKSKRRKGIGTKFMKLIESSCKDMGYNDLYLSVDPKGNSEAHDFYSAIGYRDTQNKPQWRKWSFKDSDGNIHQGEGMDIEMAKQIV